MAQSGPRLVHRTCVLLAQSGHQRPSVSLWLSAWCPKGQFISRRVGVKIGGMGSTEVDHDPHEFSCHRRSCRCVFRATACSGLRGSLVRGDSNWRRCIYGDCQYRSFEECYRRGNVLAGNRGFCNPSPYYVATLQNTRAQRNAALAPSSSAPDMSLMSASLIRPVWVKRFQTIHCCSVDVARGLVLSPESAPGPFHHGVRERGGPIYWAALPSD